jgi:hypothetical protein
MKWTSIPESFDGLDSAALKTLAATLKSEIATNLAAAETKEDLDEVKAYGVKRQKVQMAIELAEEKEAEEKAEADKAEAEAAASKEAEEAAEAEKAEKEAEEAAAKTPAKDDEDKDDDDDKDDKTVHTSTGVATTVETKPSRKAAGEAFQWLATDETPGKKNGTQFSDWTEIANALQEVAQGVTSGSDKKHVVARAPGRFADVAKMSDNALINLDMFEEEIMAALCAPLTPLYDMACESSTRRPVKNSLPVFQSPRRGGFSVYPSPTLSDITTGYGQWTAEDDANEAAVKEACQTIECATPTDYRIYGIYRCITIKNLLQMTFPELVNAYLNKLAASQARLGETLMLEAMGTGTVSIDALTLGYNASTTITSQLLNYLALYREVERWDDQTFDAWLPRWIVKAMQADQVRRRRTDGGFNLVPSEGQIAQQFRDVGVEPHFYMDRPTWATPVPNVATNGVLNQFPRHLEILVAPRGKFAAMDRGELNIGVAPGNLYRDNVSNSRNEFTLFFENFEGVINTTSCPAHTIQINNLCYNGVQVDDVIVGCEGIDEPGIGS